MLNIFYFLLTWIFSINCWADTEDLGDVSSNIVQVIMSISGLLHVICLITGGALIFGSFLQYRKHRQNPNEVPISTPIFTLIFGLILIAITFIPIQAIKNS